MCGIAGIIDFSGNISGLTGQLRRMSHTLRHRGPDDEGFVFFFGQEEVTAGSEDTPGAVWESGFPYKPQHAIANLDFHPEIGLAHRRLSIIDVSPAGHQPMCYGQSRYWIVYNGEIYNFHTIRQDLISKGYQFHSHSDTEVLLAAYAAWGVRMLDMLDGMWSFVIYDKVNQCLFAARDRHGVKPLYYFNHNNFFAFASEQKALLTLDDVERIVNQEAVFDYLIAGQTEKEPEGFFSGIIELQPSHYFMLDLQTKKLSINKYYELPFTETQHPFEAKKLERYIDETQYLVTETVKSRLMSDVKVGACLSGGIDSSVIVCLMRQLQLQGEYTASQLDVFTSCLSQPSLDERPWAQKVVEATRANWHCDLPQVHDMMAHLEELVWHQDIPFFSSNTWMHYSLMNEVKKQGVKVTIDGQGADEIFTGYQIHYFASLSEAISRGNLKNLTGLLNTKTNSFADKKLVWQYLIKGLISSVLPQQTHLALFTHTHPAYKFINTSFLSNNVYRYEKQYFHSSLNKLLKIQAMGPDLKVLLRTGDRNAMAHSVESRTPFADARKLIEYLFMIEGQYKIKGNVNKLLLRESMKNILPTAISQRYDKMGFASPVEDWLKQMKPSLLPYITPALDPFFDSQKIIKNWDLLFQKPDAKLWRVINLAIWLKVFNMQTQ